MTRFRLNTAQLQLVDAIVASYVAAGLSGASIRDSAREFCGHVGGPDEWSALSIDRQVALGRDVRRVAMWLLATARTRASAEYLLRADVFIGHAYATVHRDFKAEFHRRSIALGSSPTWATKSWKGLCLAAALNQVPPSAVTASMLDAARDEFMQTARRLGFETVVVHRISAELYRAHVVLFHAGQVDVTPRKGIGFPADRRSWEHIPDGLRIPIRRYLDQILLVRRPSTVDQIEGFLREFATFMTNNYPNVVTTGALRQQQHGSQ